MSRKRVAPMDAMFLYGETRETMMHVAGLMPFTPPADAGPDFLRLLMEEIRHTVGVQPPWNLKLGTPGFLRNPLHTWVEDKNLDIEYHVRRSALPSPGGERELGVLVSRLHSNQMDFSRPPWEMHLIEGLEGGRFALYIKIHHALVDGYTGARVIANMLSRDPDERGKPLFFTQPPLRRAPRTETPVAEFGSVLQAVATRWGSAKIVGKAMLNLRRSARDEVDQLVSSLQAPRSILNGRINRNRRFATQQYSLKRLKALGKATGATLNDVVLALCAGGLRRFLQELGELPDKPLVAFLPVNVRPKGDPGGGNAVGAMLASLGTDIADPLERLDAIVASTRRGKAQMENMSAGAIIAYSGLLMAPAGLQSFNAMTGLRARLPLTFNVCVSNVPGPSEPLYFRGARLEASYPVSIPGHGMALNITCQSYADTLNFGFIGCRDTLPHLQKLAVYTGEALEELEAAVMTRSPALA
ncbi:MAG TPA: wax ester/triacylglycerol synthase family O-acyltransferase [Solimonas sp.]|nr:wax ester/triacylglycerol synthase family O-acyltransferase [Solimonas sp.]